jgi:heterodisulfide reductase subunit B
VRLAYFPGCSLEGTALEYDLSIRAVAPLLGLELVEIEDWNCCGATAAHSLDHKLSLALPARILALAERDGFEAVLAPCAACSHRLIIARHELAENARLRGEICDIIGLPYEGRVAVRNILQVVEELGEDLRAKIQRMFTGLKIASYYGCLLVRPPEVVQFDRSEDPQTMDRIIRRLGGTPVDWAHKTECCGGGFSMSRTDMVLKMTHEVLRNAAAEGAEAIAVACPMCQSNLDMRQAAVNRAFGASIELPVLYITQWIGLALGCTPRNLGLEHHFVKTGAVVDKAFREPPKPAAPSAKPANTTSHGATA